MAYNVCKQQPRNVREYVVHISVKVADKVVDKNNCEILDVMTRLSLSSCGLGFHFHYAQYGILRPMYPK